VGVIH